MVALPEGEILTELRDRTLSRMDVKLRAINVLPSVEVGGSIDTVSGFLAWKVVEPP